MDTDQPAAKPAGKATPAAKGKGTGGLASAFSKAPPRGAAKRGKAAGESASQGAAPKAAKAEAKGTAAQQGAGKASKKAAAGVEAEAEAKTAGASGRRKPQVWHSWQEACRFAPTTRDVGCYATKHVHGRERLHSAMQARTARASRLCSHSLVPRRQTGHV